MTSVLENSMINESKNHVMFRRTSNDVTITKRTVIATQAPTSILGFFGGEGAGE